MATIGLGDVMPSSLEHNPLIALTFPVGLTLLSIMNSNAYRKLEKNLIHIMDGIERWLERFQETPSGYVTFRKLKPNIEVTCSALFFL